MASDQPGLTERIAKLNQEAQDHAKEIGVVASAPPPTDALGAAELSAKLLNTLGFHVRLLWEAIALLAEVHEASIGGNGHAN